MMTTVGAGYHLRTLIATKSKNMRRATPGSKKPQATLAKCHREPALEKKKKSQHQHFALGQGLDIPVRPEFGASITRWDARAMCKHVAEIEKEMQDVRNEITRVEQKNAAAWHPRRRNAQLAGVGRAIETGGANQGATGGANRVPQPVRRSVR